MTERVLFLLFVGGILGQRFKYMQRMFLNIYFHRRIIALLTTDTMSHFPRLRLSIGYSPNYAYWKAGLILRFAGLDIAPPANLRGHMPWTGKAFWNCFIESLDIEKFDTWALEWFKRHQKELEKAIYNGSISGDFEAFWKCMEDCNRSD
jgi:hypothetical protein